MYPTTPSRLVRAVVELQGPGGASRLLAATILSTRTKWSAKRRSIVPGRPTATTPSRLGPPRALSGLGSRRSVPFLGRLPAGASPTRRRRRSPVLEPRDSRPLPPTVHPFEQRA